jgi:hypothetical protein
MGASWHSEALCFGGVFLAVERHYAGTRRGERVFETGIQEEGCDGKEAHEVRVVADYNSFRQS